MIARALSFAWVWSVAWLAILTIAFATPASAAEKIAVGTTTRTYELVGATPGQPKPTIIALHGNRGSGAGFIRYGNWAAAAERGGFVVAAPDGLNTAWADGRNDAEFKGKTPPPGTDDVAFITDLVGRLIEQQIADPERVFLAGMSNGGMMTFRMACESPELFAAAAAIVATMTTSAASACAPHKPIPMLIINGTRDKIIPNDPSRPYIGTEATAAVFAKANGCDIKSKATAIDNVDTRDRSNIVRYDYVCPPGVDVSVFSVEGGGHQMPARSGRGFLNILLGPRNGDIEAADEIWAFFKKFER